MDGPKQAKPPRQNLVTAEDWSFLSLSPIETSAHASPLTSSCLGQGAIHSGSFPTYPISYIKAAWENMNEDYFCICSVV